MLKLVLSFSLLCSSAAGPAPVYVGSVAICATGKGSTMLSRPVVTGFYHNVYTLSKDGFKVYVPGTRLDQLKRHPITRPSHQVHMFLALQDKTTDRESITAQLHTAYKKGKVC